MEERGLISPLVLMKSKVLREPREMIRALGYTVVDTKLCPKLKYSFCIGILVKIIYLADKNDIWHEAGHAFYNTFKNELMLCGFESLFGEQRNIYLHSLLQKDNWEDGLDPNPEYPTTYAMTHPQEDWAECFQVVARNKWIPVKTKNKKLKSKYEFIRSFVLQKAGK